MINKNKKKIVEMDLHGDVRSRVYKRADNDSRQSLSPMGSMCSHLQVERR